MSKKLYLIITFSLLFIINSIAQQGMWTWMHGESTVNSPGDFGIINIASVTNMPPATYESCEWTDLQGNFWLFGGMQSDSYQRYSALWKFNPSTNMWTWVKGPNTVNNPGIYGTQGIPSSANNPGARGYGVATWVDQQGNLWLFGGSGYDVNGGTFGRLADLWKYDILNNVWTWMNGPNTINQAGNYGTQGVPNVNNYPPSREELSATWTDNDGNLWLFGGARLAASYNDLWKYDIATNQWTWIRGSNTTQSLGNYGSIGVASPTNDPPSRKIPSKWKDSNGNFWMFGGHTSSGNSYNDLWKYEISSNMWTWVNGSNLMNSSGNYGSLCISQNTNQPHARFEARSCWTDDCFNFWLFGGIGENSSVDYNNDLWFYNVTENKWVWINGNDYLNGSSIYGTIGIPEINNLPGARGGAIPFKDNNGNLWLFGGISQWAPLHAHNDLWRYVPDPACTGVNCSNNTLNVTISPNSLSCNNQCTGTATANATNGTSPYTYSWNTNPVQTTQTATTLCAGSYTVTVTDADNTTATSTVTITQPTALTASTSVTNACTGNNGSVTVTASGGTAPYTYLWSPGGATTATVTNLAPATYSVTITDNNGCTQTASATIINSTGVTASIASQANVLCNGGSTGSATVSAIGGNGPYIYLWSPSNQTTVTATNLSAGTYSVTVTDANSCVSTQSVTITQPTALTASASATQTACGVNNGTATVNASGGTGAFTYVWTPGNQTTQTATGLGANTYSVTVSDANSCTQTASAVVTNPNAPAYSSGSQTNILCNGNNTGSATVVFTGGTAPYTYLWSPGNQTTQTATNLAAGAYTITVTDNAACTNFHNIVITQPTAITLSIDSTNASCGEQNGSIAVDASGGTGAYTYVWLPSGATTDNITGLDAGTYSLLVTDANNCTKTATITLENSVAPTLSISAQTDVVCNGNSTGSATVATSGGTAPFSYSWSPSGQTTQTANNLAAGDYLVTVVDNNGCADIDSVTITEPVALATVVTQEDATCGQADGSATVTVSGGTGNYTYSWSPTDQTDSTALALGEGTHSVTITDDSGCTRTETIVIANNGNSPDAGFGFDPSTVLLGGIVNFADSSIANGNELTDWYWNFGDGTTDTVQNPVHTFQDTGSYPVMLVVTNSSGCSDTVIITIDVTTEIIIPNIITPNGDAENEFFVIPNLSAYPESKLYIYNRWGKKIYEATNYQSDWNGDKHSAGTYFYVLLLPDGSSKHGTVTVVK